MFAAGVDRLVISSDCYEIYARMDGTVIAELSSKIVKANPSQQRSKAVQLGYSTPHPAVGVAVCFII
ncbi:hypothetical protein DVH05_001459 [Phytophthora capsici]|nr:hypothetical protein DVH05_001459 [Phytophthora capsici]